jgi:hypothetical protein
MWCPWSAKQKKKQKKVIEKYELLLPGPSIPRREKSSEILTVLGNDCTFTLSHPPFCVLSIQTLERCFLDALHIGYELQCKNLSIVVSILC